MPRKKKVDGADAQQGELTEDATGEEAPGDAADLTEVQEEVPTATAPTELVETEEIPASAPEPSAADHVPVFYATAFASSGRLEKVEIIVEHPEHPSHMLDGHILASHPITAWPREYPDGSKTVMLTGRSSISKVEALRELDKVREDYQANRTKIEAHVLGRDVD